jgi:hypothetical protein
MLCAKYKTSLSIAGAPRKCGVEATLAKVRRERMVILFTARQYLVLKIFHHSLA